MLEPVRPGQALEISAQDTNMVFKHVREHLNRRDQRAPGIVAAPGNPCTVLVRNDSGADLDQYETVGIEGSVFTDYASAGFTQTPSLIALAEDVTRMPAVVQEPIAQGSFGQAVICGFTLGDPNSTIAWRAKTLVEGGGALSYFQLGEEGFWAKVHTPVVVTADRKWTYSLTPQVLDATGFFVDVASPPAIAGAINTYEQNNTAGATIQGNSLDMGSEPFVSILPDKLKPIRGDAPHWVRVLRQPDGVAVFAFSAPNIAQEDCL